MGVERRGALLLSVVGSAVLIAATLLTDRPPLVRPVDAAPTEFSAQRAKIVLQALVGDGVPHPMGSGASVRMWHEIVRRLIELGFAPELQSGMACNDGTCGRPVNIIATLDGRTAVDAVMLSAHYDSVPAGPGASDDGAGVATVLEIARILKALPETRHPIVLLIDDGEEDGLLGAALFVREHPLAKVVKAAVNLEARGTSGPSLMFETGTANAWLMQLYATVVERPTTNSAFYVAYQHLPNDTDFTVFKQERYQGFNFAFIGDESRYHTPLDNVANTSLESVQHQGDNALATLLALANSDTLRPPIGDATFFDVFSRRMAWWPSSLNLPAAIFVLVLLLAEAAILLRRRDLSISAAGWGLAAATTVPLLATAVSIGLLLLLTRLGKVPPLGGASWIASPLPMTLASAATPLLAGGCVSICFGRRTGYWGSWFGAFILSGLLSVVAAATVSGISFLFLLPALAATAVIACKSPGARDLAALLPLLSSLGLTLPVVMFLYPALGAPGWPVAALLLSPAATSLLPPLAQAGVRTIRIVLAIAALIVVIGTGATMVSSTYTSTAPERMNVEYWLDADTDHAHWFVQLDSMKLSGAVRSAADFEQTPVPRYPGSASRGFRAVARLIDLPSPDLVANTAEVSAASPVVHYALTLRSPRGARAAFIVFPATAAIHDALVDTAAGQQRIPLRRLSSGASRLDLAGLDGTGMSFGIDASPAPIQVRIADVTYGLARESELLRARSDTATRSQDGDVTVVSRTVTLAPAAGR